MAQMATHASPERQSDELEHGPDPNTFARHWLFPSTLVTHPQLRWGQVRLAPQGGVRTGDERQPHERQGLPGEHAPYCANAGVLMLVRIGADQATAAPAPIRLSTRRREISSELIPTPPSTDGLSVPVGRQSRSMQSWDISCGLPESGDTVLLRMTAAATGDSRLERA